MGIPGEDPFLSRLASGTACRGAVFRHETAEARLVAALLPDGRTVVTAEMQAPDRPAQTEFWILATSDVDEALRIGQERTARLLDALRFSFGQA